MEVGSEQRLMAGRDLFGMPKSPPAQVPGPPASAAMQSVHMAHTADGTPVFAPVTSSAAPQSYQPQGAAHGPSMSTAVVTGGNGTMAPPGMGEPVAKKKRGRPRKYGPDGSMSLALVPASASTRSPAMGQGSSGPFSSAGSNPANSVPGVSPEGVKKRGRPKGSTNKPRMDDFVCVLTANGAISNVTLRQTATSGGTVTYEGRFEILSLSGSFLLIENGGQRSRTGGLSVSLASPDGRLLGGGVAGLLIAASPIQIVLGSFNSEGKKEPKQRAPLDPASASLKVTPTTAMGPSSPPSRGTLSESSGGAGSPQPLHQGMAATASNSNQSPIMSSMPWK
ncbi:hypothetical protein HU200_041354 [Digitaria exilis]|uniref:AT-hook motif nuclear-localized protein n=1 Tax=Digitaria exilis TaxID=1010633 RepID=A0A835BIJ6_9POAL|nr:hypothetical protein HU200_041354 [Digitaria exilis]